ncbi:MAG: DUF5029 domain-containing protein [Bacteroides sp.]|nr:DUF5029 domain-containing protein [Bacteroides sp.]
MVGGDDNQNEALESISVSFVGANDAATRAANGVSNGVGDENKVYKAYVFARELAPEHTGAQVGDWTVKTVAGSADDNTAIKAGNSQGQLSNVCSFTNVRQGDNVYVIANDPVMTTDYAEKLAHHGPDSERYIKEYIAELSKSYINGLTVKVDDVAKENGRKFIMAGSSVIKASTGDAGDAAGNKNVEVVLNRELAKVAFTALITADPAYEACGKVEFCTEKDKEDGIVVVRIPRKVSYFTQWDKDWYFPSTFKAGDNPLFKDWNMTNITTAAWTNVFHGDANNASGTTDTDKPFNNNVYDNSAKEYRLTWQLKNGSLKEQLINYKQNESTTVTDEVEDNVMEAPIFYSTPNYANDDASSTVICTQATIKQQLLINDPSIGKPYQALADKLAASAKLTVGDDKYWETAIGGGDTPSKH